MNIGSECRHVHKTAFAIALLALVLAHSSSAQAIEYPVGSSLNLALGSENNTAPQELSSKPNRQRSVLRSNPFKPRFTSVRNAQQGIAEANDTFELRAILFDNIKPLVNINGLIIAIGENLNGHTLIKVERDFATIEHNGQQQELRLKQEEFADIGIQ